MTVRSIHLAFLLALVPLLGACGSTRDVLSLDPVASAATRTAKVNSERVGFYGSISGPWTGQRFGFSGSGVVDAAAGAGRMHFRFDFPPAARAQLGVNPSMDVIFQSRHRFVMYMRSRMFGKLVPGSRPWLKLDLGKMAALRGIDLDGLTQLNQTDPAQNLRLLTGAGSSRELGWDRIRGALTRHYALTVDLARLANANAQLRKSLRQMRGFATKLPAEAWIDEQGYLRKLTLRFSLARSQDGPVRMILSEEFYDFGVAARIETPPASQVTDATTLPANR